jgi:hypothetical protein
MFPEKNLFRLRKLTKKSVLPANYHLEIRMRLMRKQYLVIRRVMAILLTLKVKICILLHRLNGTVLPVGNGMAKRCQDIWRSGGTALAKRSAQIRRRERLTSKIFFFRQRLYHELRSSCVAYS